MLVRSWELGVRIGNYSGGCKAMNRTLLGVSKEFVHIAKAME